MASSRTQNTKRNIICSYALAGITFLFQFLSRSIIVSTLGEQYLGLSSLFTSILHVLNMAEMGFSGAIVYNMYKPLAEADTNTVCALLKYYRDIYRRIGLCIFLVGLIAMPFIPKLIHGSYPKEVNIYVLYILYLTNTGISYFLFAYKDSLLHAIQRMDLSKIAYTIVSIGQYALQIMAILVFQNYYLFVVFQIIGTAVKNVTVAYIAEKYYPQYRCQGEISSFVKKDIISRVKGLLICNISGVTYTTFDSIILSSCIGLTSVALYGNYITIFTGVSTLIVYVRQAMQASVGNSIATERKEKNQKDLMLWQFLFSVIALWCVTCMLNMYQPFMRLWMGDEYLLPMRDVVIICAWFAISVVQHAYYLYLSGNGLWWELRWPYICSTVFNLTFNIVLGRFFGITGVLLASLLSALLFGLIWQAKVVFKNYLNVPAYKYLRKQGYYFILTALSGGGAVLLCSQVNVTGVSGLLLRFLISSLVAVVTVIVACNKTEEFNRSVVLLKEIICVK